MDNPLQRLSKAGVSPWYDNISRALLDSGGLARMVREDGLRGVTSNPAIFEKAVSGGAYDALLRERAARGERDPRRLFETLAVEDIRRAADALRGVYDATGGEDGYVSLEVSPELARDTEGTVREALRLNALVARANLMIKVPATREGLPAVERLIGSGVNVNATLIFAALRHREVMDAYLRGLERALQAKRPLSAVASVASFFVSRIDTAVDALARDPSLRGKAAVANAKLAYQEWKRVFSAPRFAALRKKGARVQRPLWASTGTKNPAYGDVLYVEELIGRGCVNTLPPATWDAFRDHGRVRPTIEAGLDAAREALRRLRAAGVDLDEVAARLEADGVKAFSESYRSLLEGIRGKVSAPRVPTGPQPVEARGLVERIWARDPAVWKADPAHQAVIGDSLGWLTVAEGMAAGVGELDAFADEVRAAGFRRALLLGMGGSSLAPEVFRRTFPARRLRPEIVVLDSTAPEAVASADGRCSPGKTLYIVSSKSGATTEPLRLLDYFWGRAKVAFERETGSRFIAITDPGSRLEGLARERGFRKVFLNPPDIGGRYSALSYFGLVPAALAGVDVPDVLARARRMAASCGPDAGPAGNPGLALGLNLGRLAREGKDKLTFLISPGLSGLGLWLEQLLAESTGKEGKGVVPICDEPRVPLYAYGKDRAFVHIRLKGDATHDALVCRLRAAGHPVLRVEAADRRELGAEFFRWEFAAAVLGRELGINPFDQPDVQSAKDRTNALLAALSKRGALPLLESHIEEAGLALTFSKASRRHADGLDEALQGFWSQAWPGDYAAVLAYLSPWDPAARALRELHAAVAAATRVPVQAGYGPRYLHSTGQLHKGGPNSGVFLVLSREDAPDVAIPGSRYSFGQLVRAQALGDFQALDAAGRRALFARVTGDPKDALRRLARSANVVK